GYIGAIFVILLFVIFIFRGFAIAMNAHDKFGAMLAIGITSQIGLQALLNIAVVTKTIPNTGISLPFFSQGGTSLAMVLAEVGVLLAVSRYSAIKKQ
ncbi:MAG: FtsW/RodA/SpoVE family cell cycle protein, partial [Oscillospiraceae bacterium]